jgi:uncharacterized protein YggT (Ycf19 family)
MSFVTHLVDPVLAPLTHVSLEVPTIVLLPIVLSTALNKFSSSQY